MPTELDIQFRGAMRPGAANAVPFLRRRSDTEAPPVHRVPGGAFAIQTKHVTEADFDQATRDMREDAAIAPLSMWQPERESPWLIVVYLVGFITGFAASVVWPWGQL